jgi:hypothetical protein
MIVLNLICMAGHRFEGWFASTEAFDEQLANGHISCPSCNSASISRLPSGPHVAKRAPTTAPAITVTAEQAASLLNALLEGSEDVGTRFAEEARRIHFEETPARRIRGLTTLEEAEELLEEGIPVLPLPIPPKGETH